MAITLTEKAAKHITRYIERRGKGLGLRFGVRTTGCSGLAYKLEYVDEAAAGRQRLRVARREGLRRPEEPALYRRHRTRFRPRGTERRLPLQQPERQGQLRLRRELPHLSMPSTGRRPVLNQPVEVGQAFLLSDHAKPLRAVPAAAAIRGRHGGAGRGLSRRPGPGAPGPVRAQPRTPKSASRCSGRPAPTRPTRR